MTVCRHGWPGSDCRSAHPYMAEPTSIITDGPSVACVWCVRADPGLICQADLGGECPPADLGGGHNAGTKRQEAP